MKNLIVAITTVVATAISPVLAHATNNDPRAEQTFARQFVGAQYAKWTKLSDGNLRVTFVLNGIGAESYFDADGELLGTMRNLFYNQLPLPVMQTVENKFGGGSVIEVREITNADGVSYKIILEAKDKRYSLRLNSLGGITDWQKERIKK